jgi:hypothetical protein
MRYWPVKLPSLGRKTLRPSYAEYLGIAIVDFEGLRQVLPSSKPKPQVEELKVKVEMPPIQIQYFRNPEKFCILRNSVYSEIMQYWKIQHFEKFCIFENAVFFEILHF